MKQNRKKSPNPEFKALNDAIRDNDKQLEGRLKMALKVDNEDVRKLQQVTKLVHPSVKNQH